MRLESVFFTVVGLTEVFLVMLVLLSLDPRLMVC